jgi:hypothetical protein
MNEYDYVPIKLYLQEQVAGHIWPIDQGLPIPDLDYEAVHGSQWAGYNDERAKIMP